MDKDFNRLVELYRRKLQERYSGCCDGPEVSRAIDLIRVADPETLKKLIELMEGK